MTFITDRPSSGISDSHATENAMKVYVTIHGHFYQPPRENPYLNAIERQPSAYPFHDWNARIHDECYRPNAYARIFNDAGKVVGIVNNFEYLSFNIGATLMSWLEGHDPEVYQRIIDGDRRSCERLNGHGNAIAQVYNHIILPLASDRDKVTQIRWGKADFRHRFGRDPEGMWLAETAVDYSTLKALVDEGIRFTILAPSQIAKCRPLPTEINPEPEWIEVGGAQIDPTRPYRCFLKDGRYIDIFVYDGPISRDMGFGDVLSSSEYLLGKLGQGVRLDAEQSQLISVATDGETFGHHRKDTEKCLAYAFKVEFSRKGWNVTNYAHYLSIHPPTWELEIKSVTSWSCCHGVDRWQDDCGCGGGDNLQLKWRRPLRDSLNWLRDRLAEIYEVQGRHLFTDPQSARDEYIQVILDRSSHKIDEFLLRYQSHSLNQIERLDALKLLEMQRHSLLMFTSCGWFFEEISRPEGTQILRYASRAIELAGEVAGLQLESDFVLQLAAAPSNDPAYSNGAEIYQKLVQTARVDFDRVAAHYAISSLLQKYPQQQRVYCYDARQLDFQKQQIGSLTLAIGQVQLTSIITQESQHLIFAVLHIGGWDFHCCIEHFNNRLSYNQLKEKLFAILQQASMAQILLSMTQIFGEKYYNLQDLFAEERYRIVQQLSQKTRKNLDRLYTQVYRDNYGILVAFQQEQLPVPQELQVAAEIALADKCCQIATNLTADWEDVRLRKHHLIELNSVAIEANYLHCNLKVSEAKQTLEQLIWRVLWQVLHEDIDRSREEEINSLIETIEVGKKLQIGLCLDRVQELYYYEVDRLNNDSVDVSQDNSDDCSSIVNLRKFLNLI
jgi:alpha-amylase/alpha-mannosidase (GH57 family)